MIWKKNECGSRLFFGEYKSYMEGKLVCVSESIQQKMHMHVVYI